MHTTWTLMSMFIFIEVNTIFQLGTILQYNFTTQKDQGLGFWLISNEHSILVVSRTKKKQWHQGIG